MADSIFWIVFLIHIECTKLSFLTVALKYMIMLQVIIHKQMFWTKLICKMSSDLFDTNLWDRDILQVYVST